MMRIVLAMWSFCFFFFSSRRRHTRFDCDWSSDVCSSDLLQTSASDVFAAGDVANFFNSALGARLRVEHEDNANTMGAAAGRAMAGDKTPYTHLPFFYSDLFALGYEAVGELDPRLGTMSDWEEPFRD